MSPPTSTATEPPLSPSCRGFISALVLRCGAGDEKALGDLFDLTYFVVADRVAQGHGSARESARGIEDKVVEAFARIWHRARTYQPSERGPLAWVLDQAADARPAD